MTPTRWTLSVWMLGFALMDQVSKWLAREALLPQHPFVLIPDVLQLNIAYNTGAAFSLLNQQPQLLTLITTLIFGVLLIYGLGRTRFLPGEIPAFALILGGALGNLTDRFLWGRVTDFFDVVLIHYPIFNLADTFIFTGVLLLVFSHLRPYPPQVAPRMEAAPHPAGEAGTPCIVKKAPTVPGNQPPHEPS